MAGPNTDATGQIVPRGDTTSIARQEKPGQKFAALVTKMTPDLARALPKHITPERMARIVLTALRMTPKLAECTESSFLGAVLTSAQLGLEVNNPLGHAYLIPFKKNWKDANGKWHSDMQCQLIIGYQGMIELARRSGLVTSIYAYPVFDGDQFSYRLGLHPDIQHVPSEDPDRETRRITHVYAVAHQKDGPPVFQVLTWAEVMKRRERSKSKDDGPWVTDTEAMALKTAVRKLWRWLPKSVEMQRAGAVDAIDDVDVRTQPSAAWDPEVTAALEKQGLALEAGATEGNGHGAEQQTESQP
jgi:recombination protein RecT